MRKHLTQLANVVYVDVKRGIVEPSYKELTDIIAREPKNKALFKLQTKILKILKNIWRAVNEVSDEPAGR
jgi:translation initiation factor 2 alpha subunit (eIF-2alpha)